MIVLGVAADAGKQTGCDQDSGKKERLPGTMLESCDPTADGHSATSCVHRCEFHRLGGQRFVYLLHQLSRQTESNRGANYWESHSSKFGVNFVYARKFLQRKIVTANGDGDTWGSDTLRSAPTADSHDVAAIRTQRTQPRQLRAASIQAEN